MAEEKKNIKFGQIGNALRSAASDHVTAVASDIFDEDSQKYQNAINAELDTGIKSEARSRTENDTLLNQAIVAEKDRAEAKEQEFTEAIQQETARAKAAEEANTEAIAKRGIYDVSAYNGGAVFESLSALLNNANLNTLIPTSVRCGGMSIRFIQGSVPNSDNKYIQARCMAQNFTTDVTQWQCSTSEIRVGSKDLAESGAVAYITGALTKVEHSEQLVGVTKILISPLFLKKGEYYKLCISADGSATISADGYSLQLRNIDTNTNLEQISIDGEWDGSEEFIIYQADKDYYNVALRQYSVGLTSTAKATYKIENITSMVLKDLIPNISINQSVEASGIQKTRISKNGTDTDILLGYQFMSEISPSINIGNPPNRSYYIASTSGIYQYCNNIVINKGESAALIYENNNWRKQPLKIASIESVESCMGLLSSIKNVIVDIYAIGYEHDVKVTTVAFKNTAYGTDSIGINVQYLDNNGNAISGTEDSLYIENVSSIHAGNIVRLKNFSVSTDGKATHGVVYYIRLNINLDWSAISQSIFNTNIILTKIGLLNDEQVIKAYLEEKYCLNDMKFDILSQPNNVSLTYYNFFSEIFVKGCNANYDIIVAYLGFNHSAFGGDNMLGIQLGYKIGNSLYSLSNFAVDAHEWGANELHEIPNYYTSPMSKSGIRLFVKTSPTWQWRSSQQLINGNLLNIKKNRFDVDIDAFTTLEVGQGKDFTTLRSALDFVNGKSSKNNKFRLLVSAGIYELTDEYTEEEIKTKNFRGYDIPDFVLLEGDNSNGDVIISCTLSDAISSYNRGDGQYCGVYMSTLNPHNTSWLKNLIVTADNVKYPIHDDWATTSLERKIINCKFIHNGGTWIDAGYCHAYGGGCRADGHYQYKDCEFESKVGIGYLMHTSKNWGKISSLYFKNCRFHSFNPTSHDVYISSLGNGLSAKSPVFFENCEYGDTGLYVGDSLTAGDYGWDWKVSGVGNVLCPIFAESDDISEEHYVAMIDETVEMVAYGAITQFQPATFVNNCKVKLMTNEALNTFKGIALNSASDGDKVIIKFRGYLHYSELGLNSISYGDKVKVNSDGTFGITTGDEWIGYCDKLNYVRLREQIV